MSSGPVSATEEEIIRFCKERLAAYKAPRVVEFRQSLPKSMVGKVFYKDLRQEMLRRAQEQEGDAAVCEQVGSAPPA